MAELPQEEPGETPPPPPICHFLTTIPLEIRLEIYKYLLVLDLQPPQFRPLSTTTTKQAILPTATTTSTSDLTTTATNPPNPSPNSNPHRPPPLLHPSILSTHPQIYHEALPILYRFNTFLAHESNLTISPSLFIPPPSTIPPTSHAYTYKCPSPYLLSRSATPISVSISPSIHSPRPNPNIYMIRRWRIRVRLDCGFPPWAGEDVARAFSGAEELTLCVYRAVFVGGVGVDVLRRFERVRGVRRVRILGCVKGFEGYVKWLEGVMMRESGEDVDGDGDAGKGKGKGKEERWTSDWEDGNGNGNDNEGSKEVFMVGGYRCANELERKRLTGALQKQSFREIVRLVLTLEVVPQELKAGQHTTRIVITGTESSHSCQQVREKYKQS
ncbi:hypothetical protein V8F20_005826 [Naviculisporaceae sp. PSN 640]